MMPTFTFPGNQYVYYFPTQGEQMGAQQQPMVYPVLVPPVNQSTTPTDTTEPTALEVQKEPQVVENPLETLELSLLAQQDLVNRRRVGIFMIIGLAVLLGFTFYSPVPLGVIFTVCGFYLFGAVAVRTKSPLLISVFALAHLYPFYMVARIIYDICVYETAASGWFIFGLDLGAFAVFGSFLSAIRYAGFLRSVAARSS